MQKKHFILMYSSLHPFATKGGIFIYICMFGCNKLLLKATIIFYQKKKKQKKTFADKLPIIIIIL